MTRASNSKIVASKSMEIMNMTPMSQSTFSLLNLVITKYALLIRDLNSMYVCDSKSSNHKGKWMTDRNDT